MAITVIAKISDRERKIIHAGAWEKISSTAGLNDWFSAFMKRHPELKIIKSVKLEKNRSMSCTPEIIIPLSNEKRRFVLERPYGESLTSVEALRKVHEKEKFDFKRKKLTSITREERQKSEKVRSKW
ncbi:unnamed protein product [Rotaria sp. Silwood2]|nr:unnamed protein product [Rotaria sp. Silwood2]